MQQLCSRYAHASPLDQPPSVRHAAERCRGGAWPSTTATAAIHHAWIHGICHCLNAPNHAQAIALSMLQATAQRSAAPCSKHGPTCPPPLPPITHPPAHPPALSAHITTCNCARRPSYPPRTAAATSWPAPAAEPPSPPPAWPPSSLSCARPCRRHSSARGSRPPSCRRRSSRGSGSSSRGTARCLRGSRRGEASSSRSTTPFHRGARRMAAGAAAQMELRQLHGGEQIRVVAGRVQQRQQR
jgi:hypothetical protein